jgi:hypothetical protein
VKGSSFSTHKQVVVHKLDKGLVKGFVDPESYLRPDAMEVLDREGRLVNIPLSEVKGVFFVRKFEGNPQGSERKVFRSRPRLAGLWVRLTFKDNEVLEGVVPNNLLAMNPLGFSLTPPDPSSNNLRLFIPRSALVGIEVLGVVPDGAGRRGAPKRGMRQTGTANGVRQIDLFSPPGPAATK